MRLSVTKRQKFLIHTAIISALLYYFSIAVKEKGLTIAALMFIVTIAGLFITHRPNSKVTNTLITSVLQITLCIGFILVYIYFPNFSKFFKLFMVAAFALLFYLSSLINNVFLVVESRKETIPLYRVAITWSKIMLATISIPLLAGLFKVSINSLLETALIGLISTAYFIYFIRILKFNKDVKKYKAGEIVSILLLAVFLVISACVSVTFFPSESFLRALFVSSVLIFGISYIEGHLKKFNKP